MDDKLNPAQRSAIETPAGPMLVLAGAGTGKTRVVTCRIARLILDGVSPDRILAVTFTNKAAREMQQRAGQLLGRRRKQKPEISTFHSLCVRILRRNITRLGYPARFAIYDRGDQESVARGALREVRIPSAVLRPADLLYLIGRWKSNSWQPEQAAYEAETDKEHLAASAYARYQKALRTAGAVDFDDLLLLTEQLFTRFAKVRRSEAARFDHLLIDEYQDTNASQYHIVKALACGHRNLCVVGDDDQSIYGWRGADVEHILRFQIDWPDAKVVRLERNYRSRPPILEMANQLIIFNRQRHEKQLRAARRSGERPRILQLQDESEEARTVVKDIRAVLGGKRVEPRDIAILFRTNEQPRTFEMELRRADLPYVLVGGMSFYDRREVRDVLAYLKVAACPQDEVALLRIINRPARGISEKTVAALMGHALQRAQPLWDVLGEAARVPEITRTAAGNVLAFREQLQEFSARFAGRGSLVDNTSQLIEAIGYRRELERTYSDPQELDSRWEAVEQVVNAVGLYAGQTRQATLLGFLDSAALGDRDDDKESQLQRNGIALMTLHAAKGLEFPQVYLVGLEEGLLPHRRSLQAGDAAIDEERRLCYVGVTRAQDRLTISLALTRQKWGKARDTIPSRFLYELTGQADHPNAKAARAGKPPQRRPARAPR